MNDNHLDPPEEIEDPFYEMMNKQLWVYIKGNKDFIKDELFLMFTGSIRFTDQEPARMLRHVIDQARLYGWMEAVARYRINEEEYKEKEAADVSEFPSLNFKERN